MSFYDTYWKAIIDSWTERSIIDLIKIIEKKKAWDLDYLKPKCEETDKTMSLSIENKQRVISNFKIMINKVNAHDDKAGAFKVREYSDTIKAVEEYDGSLETLVDAEEMLISYGKKTPSKTLNKIEEILTKGYLQDAEDAKTDPLVQAVTNLTTVYSIGNKKAISLYNGYGITTIDQLKSLVKKDSKVLHAKQSIGLQYYDNLNDRIPRHEIVEYEKILIKTAQKIDPSIKLSINGSYRREMVTSGDIDVMISSPISGMRKKLLDSLFDLGIIVETLANGQKKFMGISTLPGSDKFRHIDIIETSPEEYAFGVLYFTGSGGFNVKMRRHALNLGYSLNEYTLSDSKTKIPVESTVIKKTIGKSFFETEEDIFKFLGMEYVLPKYRNNVTSSKI